MQLVQYISDNGYQELATHVQNLSAGISNVSEQIGKLFDNAIRDLTKLLKSTDSLDTVLRVCSESISLYRVVENVQKAAEPLVKTLDTFRNVISINRIVYSVKYITSGDIWKDIVAHEAPRLISEAAYLVARSIRMANWLADNKLVSREFLNDVSREIGEASVSFGIPKIPQGVLVEGLFTIALVPGAVKSFQNIANGKDVPRSLADLISACADIALGIFSMIRESKILEFLGTSLFTSAVAYVIANPYVLGTLGVIAATTGLAAIFLSPSTTTSEK
jgi:hypothetical protein